MKTRSNKTRYDLKSTLLLLFSLSAFAVQAQDFYVETSFETSGSGRFSVCGGEREISVRLSNISTNTLLNDTITFELPTGFDYSSGSLNIVSGAGLAEVDTTVPSFAIAQISPSDVVEFSIMVEVLCPGISNATGSANTTFNINQKYTGGNGSYTYTSTFFEVVKPALSINKINGVNSISPPIFNAGLYNKETVCVTVVNGGNGALPQFEYWLIDHPQLTLDSLTIAGYGRVPIDRTSGDTMYFIITTAMIANATPFSAPGAKANNTSRFQFNETIDLCEHWETTDCALNAPDIRRAVQYRCQRISACEAFLNLQGVRFGNTAPDMRIGFVENFGKNSPTCRGDILLEHGYYITNIGSEAMANMKFSLTTNWDNNGRGGTLLDTASIQFSLNSRNGPYFKIPIDHVRMYPYPNSSCLDELSNIDPITRASFSPDLLLAPGDTLFMRYGYKVGCNCGDVNRNERHRIEFDYRRRLLGYWNGSSGNNKIDYTDGCGQFNYTENFLQTYSLYYYYNTRGQGPAKTSYDGDIETIVFQAQRNLGTNAYRRDNISDRTSDNRYNNHNTNFECQDCYQEVRYIFPKGVRWTGINGDVNTSEWTFYDNDNDTWQPSYVKYAQTSDKDTLIIRTQGQIPSGFWMSANSRTLVNYQIDCAEAGCGFFSGVPIIESIYFNISGDQCGSCIENPDQVDHSENVPITFHCPCNPCSEGMVVKSVKPERRTFGQPDANNNTITEAGEVLDTSLLYLNRVIPGDTIRVTFRGEVKTSTNFPNWEYAYANIKVPNAINDFIPVGANVTIWDVSTGNSYTCSVLQQFLDGQTIVTNLSPASLRSLGCTNIPNNWRYENGDSLTVNVNYMTRTNVGGDIKPYTYGIDFYVSDQSYNGTKYQCNPIDYTLQHIGYAFYHSFFSSRYSMEGCSNGYSDVDHRARLGANWSHRSGPDYFPYEVRAPFQPTTYRFVKNNDLDFTGELLIRHYALPVNHPYQWHQLTIDLTDPYLTLVEDTLLFDYKGWYNANNNGKVSLDQGFYVRMFAGLKANCETQQSDSYNKYMNIFMAMKTDSRVHGQPQEERSRNDVNDIRYRSGANLAIQAVPKTKTAIQSVTCYSIDLVNPGRGTAENAFLYLESLSGGVVVKDLYEVNGNNRTLITPTSTGIYQLGTVNSGANGTRTFELCLQTNNCSTDSLAISTGWDCRGYPVTISESVCNITDKIFIEAISSELGMIVTNPLSSTTSDLCDEVEYEVELSSATLGALFDVHFMFSLPPNMNYVPGSMSLLYPVAGSYATIANPTNLFGNIYQINISDQLTTLKEDGLPGTLDVGNNVMRVKFRAATDCNYASGSRPRFLSYAYDPCGRFANYRVSPGERHYITGVSEPFASSVFVQDATLDACQEETTTLDISLTLTNNSQSTGSGDSVRVILPEGVRFVPNSYNPISNAANITPFVVNDGGTETVYIDLPNGLTAGSSTNFTIDIQAYDVGQDCRDYDYTVQAYNTQSATCVASGNTCNVRVISSEVTKSLTVEKPSYTIDWIDVDVTPVSATSNRLDYSVQVTNQSGIIGSGGVNVEVYQDMDGDGRYSAIDELIGTTNFTATLNPYQPTALSGSLIADANRVCNLLAVIRPQTSCACNEDETFLLDAQLENIFDSTATTCSNNAITFGPTPTTGYSYQWFSIEGSDLSALSATNTTPVQFNYDNNTGSNLTWQYGVRTIIGNNCYSLDTMTVTIFREIEGDISVGTCQGFPVPLNAPSGTTGSWTPTTNLVDPNDPNSTMSNITNTITYTWNYTDVNGCAAIYRQTVNIAGCAPSTMIGDYVWRDDNRNGIQDAGEPPLANVPVYLYDADNTNASLATTTTDANGYYQFKPIPAGNYRVGFGNPYSYDVSAKDQGSDDELDSDIDPTTGITDAILVANGDSITTIDAGFMPMQTIGDYVWADLDSNGIQNANEPPIEGATVRLHQSDGTLVASTPTDARGLYQFRVPPADYYIVFDVTTNTAGRNYVSVPQNAGGDDAADSDAAPNTGRTANFTVVPGVNITELDAGFNGVEDCGNGADDDYDGDTDCDDSDCMPTITNVTFRAPNCIGGGSNGSITITATGRGTLEYSINNSPVWQTNHEFTNLSSGQYTVRVRNNGGCIATYGNNPILFDIGACVEICNDGIDNDGDGDIDCDDSDCEGIGATQAINND